MKNKSKSAETKLSEIPKAPNWKLNQAKNDWKTETNLQ